MKMSMKGHDYGLKCKKCGKHHQPTRGMLGKSNKGCHKGVVTWSKGLTKFSDERVARQARLLSESFKNRPKDIERLIQMAHDPEIQKKRSATFKKNYTEGKYTYFKGRKPSQKNREAVAKAFLKLQKEGNWPLETKLLRICNDNMYYPESQYPILKDSHLVTIIDLAFSRQKVAIYADGCYWHGCPTHFPERGKRELDKKIDDYLTQSGWTVLRFWEHDINSDKINQIVPVALRAIDGLTQKDCSVMV